MSLPFTNIHTHVFTSECVPDNFLRILPIKAVRVAPRLVKGMIDSKIGRSAIHGLFKLFSRKDSNQRGKVDKYVAFLDVGTEATQLDVFRKAYEAGYAFDSAIRIVGLTMNMDYMDNQPARISFETQLEEIKAIKRYYPTHFFPFMGIDPRHPLHQRQSGRPPSLQQGWTADRSLDDGGLVRLQRTDGVVRRAHRVCAFLRQVVT